MPAVPPQIPPNAFRVLVTGFGPFMHYDENPSWLAVKPLQNAILHTVAGPDKTTSSSSSTPTTSISSIRGSAAAAQPIYPRPSTARPIHITTLQIPVIYESVLAMVPALHARPPILPPTAPEDSAPTPQEGGGYDFVFHIGVAGRGPLRMERLGHKLGYHMKDASGKLAPLVRAGHRDFGRRAADDGGGLTASGSANGVGMGMISPAESIERERLGMDMVEIGGDAVMRPTRGFGLGYENFQEEYTTDIDVTRLVQDLKRSGVEQIYTSMDAGHYLCDFIYYCSLAEVRRARNRSSKPYEPDNWSGPASQQRRTPHHNTQVLFLHCPPVNHPLSTEEVTEAIKRIVVWVCGEQQVGEEAEAEAEAAA